MAVGIARAGWRPPAIPVLRPATALRRIDRLSATGKSREALRSLAGLARRGMPAAQLRLARTYLEGVDVPRSRWDAMLWCGKAADAGLVEAQTLMAAMHLDGPASLAAYGLFPGEAPRAASGPDLDAAFRWATVAASGGCADAKAILAHLHAHGPEALRDPARSEALYRESAEAGSAKGAFGYGLLLLQRTGAAATPDQAAAWIEKAADGGLPFADYVYGCLCEHGVGVTAGSPATAAPFFERAARRGVPPGQSRWGMLLIEGRHVARNAVEGESWLRKAALAGEADAAGAVGDLYGQERDLPPNLLEAATWYRHAAERNHAASAFKLARLLSSGGPGLPRDLDEAIRWYCSAAENGHRWAWTDLAALMRAGTPPVHRERVRTWFETRAQAGDGRAALELGLDLLRSGGSPYADEQARFWLRRAADTENEARYWYGCLLAEGRGGPADPEAGRAFIARAAGAGMRDAQVLLAEMMLNGRGGARDHAGAFRIFEQAARAGHSGAAFATGMMLRGGYETAPDPDRALFWLGKAASAGHVHAREIVGTAAGGASR